MQFQGFYSGRDDWIRTSGLCVPNATLYQAEPHPGVCNQICVSIADLYIVALIADFFKNFIRENENIFVLAAAAHWIAAIPPRRVVWQQSSLTTDTCRSTPLAKPHDTAASAKAVPHPAALRTPQHSAHRFAARRGAKRRNTASQAE